MSNHFQKTKKISPIAPMGATGTRIYGGYIYEEYLAAMRPYQRALIFDQMRRSEPAVGQLIKVGKTAMESCSAFVAPRNGTDKQEAEFEKQKEFIEFCLFQNMYRSFDEVRKDIYSFMVYGFSLFEGLWKNETTPYGNTVALKDLLWRSPKTISEWRVDKNEQLEHVVQRAYGDGQQGKGSVILPAENVFLFILEREGNLFEGISPLRRVYGFYQLKQNFMQQLLVGCDKYSVDIPIVRGPLDQQDSHIWARVQEAVQNYRGGDSSFLMLPKTFELTVLPTKFDPQKLVQAIDACDRAMFAESLAYFLDMKDSGSYSLGSAVMKFFFLDADEKNKVVSHQFNKRIIPFLLERNGFGESLVELRFSQAGKTVSKEFSETLSNFTNSGHIRPDDSTEEFLRESLGIPEMELTRDEAKEKSIADAESLGMIPDGKGGVMPRPMPEGEGDGKGEGKGESKGKPKSQSGKEPDDDKVTAAKKKSWDTPNRLIDRGEKSIKELFGRIVIRESMAVIRKLRRHWNNAKTDVDKRELPQELVKTNRKKIKSDCYREMLAIYENTRLNAQTEIIDKGSKRASFAKKPARVYSENDAFLMANLLSEEIENDIGGAYISHSVDAENFEELEARLTEAVAKVPEKKEVAAQNILSAAKAVNTARLDLFREIEDEIESYTYMNVNPKVPLCRALNGTTTDKDKVKIPPWHFGCKTYINPNMKKWRNNPEIENVPITDKLKKDMEFLT